MEKTGDPETNNKNIQPGYLNGRWHYQCAMVIMKSGIREITGGIEQPNQEKSDDTDRLKVSSKEGRGLAKIVSMHQYKTAF